MRHKIIPAALLLLLLFPIVQLADFIRRQTVSDYATYWLASTYISRHPGADIYTAQGEKAMHSFFKEMQLHRLFAEEFENTQTPLLYGTVYWLSTGNILRDSKIFQTASLIVFSLALAFFFSQVRLPAIGGFFVALYVLLAFPPFRFEMANANVNRLLLGLVAFSLWLGRQQWRSAPLLSWAVWGLAISFKPTVALAPVLLLGAHGICRQGKRIYLEALGLLCGGMLAFFLGCWFCGDWSCWFSWLERLTRLPLSASPLEHFNFSISILVAAGLAKDIPDFIMGILMVASCLLILWLWFRGRRRDESFLANHSAMTNLGVECQLAALGLLIYLLWSPLVWVHYHLLCLPMLIILIRRNIFRWPTQGGGNLALAALTLVAMALLSNLPVLFLHSTHNVLLVLGVLVWLGVALLFLLGLIDFGRMINSASIPEH